MGGTLKRRDEDEFLLNNKKGKAEIEWREINNRQTNLIPIKSLDVLTNDCKFFVADFCRKMYLIGCRCGEV